MTAGRRLLLVAFLSVTTMLLAAFSKPKAQQTSNDGDLLSELTVIQRELAAKRQHVASMFLRVRRTTSLSSDTLSENQWRSLPVKVKHLGVDDVVIGFMGDRRYQRIFELDYRSTSYADSLAPFLERPIGAYVDDTRVWVDGQLTCRTKGLDRQFTYSRLTKEDSRDVFRVMPYMGNIGWAIADPTASLQSHLNIQQLHQLPDLLKRWQYTVVRSGERVEGDGCVVLAADFDCLLPDGDEPRIKHVSDKIWLIESHGFALKKRELNIDGRLIRTNNLDFEEVADDIWLPRRSRVEFFLKRGTSRPVADEPVLTEESTLCLSLMNNVPAEYFRAAAIEDSIGTVCVFDSVPAYKSRFLGYSKRGTNPQDDRVDLVAQQWGVRGVGWRQEIRRGTDLELHTIKVCTPRWFFVWDARRNSTSARPVRPTDPIYCPPKSIHAPRAFGSSPAMRVWTLSSFLQETERSTGVCSTESVVIDGVDGLKVTSYLPPDTSEPIGPRYFKRSFFKAEHGVNPKRLSQLPGGGRELRSRTMWFDRATGLQLRKECGCKRPNNGIGDSTHITYPDPDSVPSSLFTRPGSDDAQLSINDPELGEAIVSRHSQPEQ